MAYRALIIAAEKYPNMTGGILKELPGTLQAALDFRKWLEIKWQEEGRPADQTEVLFCSEPVVDRGRSAGLADIRASLRQLKDVGANTTDELYVFFSGHGFTFNTAVQGRTDYILASDCQRPDLTPECCITFDGLVAWLRDHLGHGRHYYFVDACRNLLSPAQVMPGPLGLPIDPQSSGEPSTFVLQSTNSGAVADAGTGFPSTLLDGLRGKGKAKVYIDAVPDGMVVNYGSLRDYVKDTLRNQKAVGRNTGDLSEGDAVLATIRPIPSFVCTVRVDDVIDGDKGTLFLRRSRGALEQRLLDLPVMRLTLEPDRYSIGVRIKDNVVSPDTLVSVDVYDDMSLIFTKTGHLTLGGAFGAVPDEPAAVPGAPRGARQAGPVWSGSLPHDSIATHLPHSNQGVDFSESLGGEVTDTSLDLWLALLGGGRILPGRPGEFHKIAKLPLYDFSAEPAGASPVYVLSGLPADIPVDVSVTDTPTAHWQPIASIQGMPGIQHLHVEMAPGPKLVSFRLPNHPTWTVASLTTPNRATLMTLTLEADLVQISQYLLPIGHLVPNIPPDLRWLVESRQNPLDDVRALASAGRAFRSRRDIGRELPAGMVEDLCFAKWVDPIGSAFAAYQLFGRGTKDRVVDVARNMLRFFPDLPDSAALATLVGLPATRRGIPLFLDGLRAYPDYAEWLPLPAGLLDFSSPWTAWRGAV